jgi:hypothetical protein
MVYGRGVYHLFADGIEDGLLTWSIERSRIAHYQRGARPSHMTAA